MFRTLAAVLILVAGISVAASTEHPDVRYGASANARACLGRQVVGLPLDTDIVLIGTSRLRRGVSAMQIEEMLGDEFEAYNMGRPDQSTARSFVLLRDLYARGVRPDLVVVEMAEEAIRGVDDLNRGRVDWRWNSDTAIVFSYKDLLELPLLSSDAGWLGWVTLIGQGVLKKLENNIVRRVTGDLEALTLTDGSQPEKVCMLDRFDNPDDVLQVHLTRQLQDAKTRVLDNFGDPYEVFDDRFDFDPNSYVRTELHYLDKIRKLTDANGSKLLLVRLHKYAAPPYSDHVLSELRSVLPELAVPPAEILRQTYEGFVDQSHMGPEGRKIYTAWLVGEIQAALRHQ